MAAVAGQAASGWSGAPASMPVCRLHCVLRVEYQQERVCSQHAGHGSYVVLKGVLVLHRFLELLCLPFVALRQRDGVNDSIVHAHTLVLKFVFSFRIKLLGRMLLHISMPLQGL